MNLIEIADPFIMQVAIVPLAVILLGVLAAIALKRFYIGPIATLILTLAYNPWYFSQTFPGAPIPMPLVFSWCIIFPVFSLFLSWFFVSQGTTLKSFFMLMTKNKSCDSK
ncbi:hypothetical protein QWY14_04340 [Planococcus sp. N028]|uniref:Uncharacterized protein n=1 Tax=Planococcus shixiaomingii TaxID=3058393 RepID=A0ABT8MZE2_9BACL|nr:MULTISPECIES: hypothetical protein [unclassified Planococcus (in: firmicutes)]MDN7241004.1 hypothetical protein [Planococcus sp. N028]WKA53258.1 hypothetical protein QWY21_11360 [Planococcus sp. N022]